MMRLKSMWQGSGWGVGKGVSALLQVPALKVIITSSLSSASLKPKLLQGVLICIKEDISGSLSWPVILRLS